MKRRVKKYLVPHEENQHKPHVFRAASAIGLAIFICAVFLGSVAQQTIITSPNFSAVISSTLVDLTNENRLQHELSQLAVNKDLQKAAQLKANDMAEKGYFAHRSPEGLDPWHWFQEADYEFVNAGENLAVNFSDSINVEQAWMNSPGHRANILNENFTEIGIATAQGLYEGRQTTFVVQMFGTPAAAEEEPAESETPSAVEDQGSEEETTDEEENVEQGIVSGTDQNGQNGEEDVLAETAVEVIAEDDMFIAVKNTEAAAAAPESVSNYAPWYAELLASPQTTLKYVYTILAAFVIIALLLTTFIEIRRQHISHILIAVSLLVLMVVLLYFGREFIFPEVIIKEALGH